jgi:hypothetical protein
MKDGLSDGDDLLRATLSQRCVDDPEASAGRWSPALMYLPMAFAVSMTGDTLLFIFSSAMMILMTFLSLFFNEPGTYKYLRLGTFLVRVGFLVLYCLMTAAKTGEATSMGLLGYFLGVLSLVCDIIFGDIKQARAYALLCRYKIIRELPNRVFLCQREGACHTARPDELVPEIISGMAIWQSSWILVADIKGLLVELRIMKDEDWLLLNQDYNDSNTAQTFHGLDMYDFELPTAQALIDAMGSDIARLDPAEAAMVLAGKGRSNDNMPKPPGSVDDPAPPSELPPAA